MGSSGLKTTDFEEVICSVLLKSNLISGIILLKDGGGLEKKDNLSPPSPFTPLFVSGTDLGLKAVPILPNKVGSSVLKPMGSPVSNSTSGNIL